MNFKEAIEDDVENVYLDTDTFAEIHKVNGEDMAVFIAEGEFGQLGAKYGEEKRLGVYENSFTMYVSAKNLKKPKPGTHIDIDGKIYRVITAVDESGIRRITLSRTEGR